MTLPNIPPSPGDDWRSWAASLRDYLMKERAQSGKAAPSAPQIIHKKSGESAAQDGVMIYNPVDEELEVSVGGGWKRIIRNEIEYLDFDQAANFAVGSGQMAWNAAEGTLDLGLNNGAVVLQLGQEIHYRVKNSTGSTIANGSVVSAAGTDGASGHILIQKFIADGSIAPRFLLGVATEDIPNGEFGYVTHFGKLGVNTSGFSAGSVLYPSATVAGALTATPPVSPDYEMPIAYALNSKSNGTIFVRVQTGYNLFELFDVKIDTPADGQFLRYDTADGRWENKTANLDALSDVVVTTPVVKQTIRYNGTNWVNALLLFDDLSDVVVTTPVVKQTIRYDGTNWVNALLLLDDLSDVVITGAATGEVLRYNGTNWVDAFLGLDDLSNVSLGTAATGEVLRYNGTNWVDARLASTDLSDSSSLPRIVAVPATATSTGTAGQIAYDTSYLYVCVATNTWRRVAIATW